MAKVTDADREKARGLVDAHTEPYYDTGAMDCDTDALIPTVAAALAEEREKARAPFLALADEIHDLGDLDGSYVANKIRRATEDAS